LLFVYSYVHDYPVHSAGLGAVCGGFPAMTERVAFLMKDLVLLAASFYLLRQDVLRSVSSRVDATIQPGGPVREQRLADRPVA
jgi:hypothetical protein